MLADATSAGRALLTAANAAAQRTLLGLGTSSVLDVGTSANQVVQLTAAAKLPAIDGSLLDLRQPVGDYMAFSMLVLKEGIAPTGNSGLTAPQQATYQYGWGALSSSVTCSAGGNPAYQDNTLIFGWNANGEVYNESSIHISFESEFANSGLEADKAMEVHIDGNTRDGHYFRLMTLLGPKNDETNLDNTTGVVFAVQRIEMRDYAYGQGTITPGFVFDFRDSEARFKADADTTIDTLQTGAPGFRQLIDEPTQLYANLPWVDTSLVCHIEQDIAVTGRMVATGRISGNEIRLNDYTYNRIASGDSGGGYIGGYNVVNAPGPELAENGTGAGIYYGSSGIKFYAFPSGSAGDAMYHSMEIDQLNNPGLDGKTPMLLMDLAKGSVQRVSIGASDSGGTGYKVLRVPN